MGTFKLALTSPPSPNSSLTYYPKHGMCQPHQVICSSPKRGLCFVEVSFLHVEASAAPSPLCRITSTHGPSGPHSSPEEALLAPCQAHLLGGPTSPCILISSCIVFCSPVTQPAHNMCSKNAHFLKSQKNDF